MAGARVAETQAKTAPVISALEPRWPSREICLRCPRHRPGFGVERDSRTHQHIRTCIYTPLDKPSWSQ